jgi:hypothetical protein
MAANEEYECDVFLSPKLMLLSPPNALAPCSRESADRRFLFALDSELGKGASGCSVELMYDSVAERNIAAKIMPNDRDARREIRMFAHIASRLSCKSGIAAVPELYGACEVKDGSHVAMYMQLLKPINAKMRGAWQKYASGMRRCLAALHSIGVAHGDVHVGNFMWDPEAEQGDDGVRIIDFGLSFDYLSEEAVIFGARPKSPRGQRHPNLCFAFLPFNSETKRRDFCVDDIKLESAIDMLTV